MTKQYFDLNRTKCLMTQEFKYWIRFKSNIWSKEKTSLLSGLKPNWNIQKLILLEIENIFNMLSFNQDWGLSNNTDSNWLR